jgi:SAM-dependent methyltransferase
VEDGAFDVVTCQQGLQFFPDRAAAVREIRRVLKPPGRVVAAVWREIALQPSLAAVFSEQGFRDVSVVEVRRPLVYEGGIAQVIATLGA